MRRRAAMLTLSLLILQPILSLAAPTPAHAGGGEDVLGHLYAGTSDPAVVYKYVSGTDWEAISPLPPSGGDRRGGTSAPRVEPPSPAPYQRLYLARHAQTPLGRAVLDLTTYEGHLYAGTISQSGTGQVWRHDGGTAWTLVGDDLDDRVSSLQTYQGELHAATGACGTLVYKYAPGTTANPTADWTLQADRTALFGGIDEGHRQAAASVPCVHDAVEHRGDAYLAAHDTILRLSSHEGGWHPLLPFSLGHPRALEILNGLLYIGYHSGDLRVTDSGNGPGELVFAAPAPIRSMTTDQRALYVGTGSVPEPGSTQSGAGQEAGGRIYRIDDPRGDAELISGDLGASIQALYAVGPSGLDLSKLERGDILLVRGPGVVNGVIGFVATYLGGSYWIHGGMYAGEGHVVESSSAVADDFGMVRTTTITETLFWEEENYWAAVRVTQQDARDPATGYAEGQEGDLYNVDYPFWGLPVKQICQLLGPIIGIDPAVCCAHPVTDRETEDDCFYCTHLPWRAYHTQGINLDSDAAWPARLFAPQAIPGDDLYYDDDVTLVDQKKGMQAVVISLVGSSVDLLVIDPEGRRTGVDPDTGEIVDEIPEITYGRIELPSIPLLDVFLPDEWESDFASIPNLDDTWEIRITSTRGGDYMLGAERVDWQHHHTQTLTRTTKAGQVDTFKVEYPENPASLIIRTSEVYLPLVMRGR